MNPGEVGRWFSFSLVRLALAALAAPCSLGCAGAADDESSIETEESEDELRTSSTNVYSCSVFSEYRDQGWDERVYLRVSKTRVTWNKKNDFRKSAGATVMPRDTDYTPPANSPGYTRYESIWTDQEGRVQGSYNWRVASSMLTGGSSMPGDRVGGYATFGRRIDSDGYASARYLCSRK